LFFLLIIVLADPILYGGPDCIIYNNDDNLSNHLDDEGPRILSEPSPDSLGEPESFEEDEDTIIGRQCPACLVTGDSVWVVPGTSCYICGTPVN